jgi:hypothetical protein
LGQATFKFVAAGRGLRLPEAVLEHLRAADCDLPALKLPNGYHVNNTWIQLFEDGKAQRSFAGKHVGSDILTVPVQSHIDA